MSWDKPPTKVDSATVSKTPDNRFYITATTKTGKVALEFSEEQWRKLWSSGTWIQTPR